MMKKHSIQTNKDNCYNSRDRDEYNFFTIMRTLSTPVEQIYLKKDRHKNQKQVFVFPNTYDMSKEK